MVSIKKEKRIEIVISILALFCLMFFLLNTKSCIEASLNGILIWGTVVLPGLLPFMFFTKILTELGIIKIIAQKFTFFSKMYNVPPISFFAFFVSIISGYPVGAKVVSDLYINGNLTSQEAVRTSTFCSNSGPMFILGSVGIGMFHSAKIGILMFVSHILGALCNGLIYRKHHEKHTLAMTKIQKNDNLIGDTMQNTVNAVLIVGGYISLFFVIISLFEQLQFFYISSSIMKSLFGINQEICGSIFQGLFEITKGCLDLSKIGLPNLSLLVIGTVIITFGGIATMLQGFAFTKKFGIKTTFFIKQKITHTIFACVISYILGMLLL